MADQCDGESSVTCALSAVSRVFQFSTAKRRETDGVTRFFRFVLRSSTNPHQSFRSVSIRRNSLQRFSSPSFICSRGGEGGISGPIIIDTIHHPRSRLLPISFLRGRRRRSGLRNYVPCVSDFIISVGGTCADRRA